MVDLGGSYHNGYMRHFQFWTWKNTFLSFIGEYIRNYAFFDVSFLSVSLQSLCGIYVNLLCLLRQSYLHICCFFAKDFTQWMFCNIHKEGKGKNAHASGKIPSLRRLCGRRSLWTDRPKGVNNVFKICPYDIVLASSSTSLPFSGHYDGPTNQPTNWPNY